MSTCPMGADLVKSKNRLKWHFRDNLTSIVHDLELLTVQDFTGH
ncbi:hypothetical protein [Sinorhizobium sp. RAC02]|nr:hypothetical protein [Sinorhizobium sp. RAC02]